MYAGEPAVGGKAHAHEDIAAERLDQGRALARRECRRLAANGARRESVEQLADDANALSDLVQADHQASIDVAGRARPEAEVRAIVRRIGEGLARVEGASRCAADKATRGILADQGRRNDAGGDGAILQRGQGIVDALDLGPCYRQAAQYTAHPADAVAR